MDKIIIEGGAPLRGEARVSGAKNAALPAMAAALLCPGDHRLSNVPDLADVRTMGRLLTHMGCELAREGDEVALHVPESVLPEAPYELVKTMRASVLALGPLVARFGRARVSLPGGCAIGARPIDQHLAGLSALGAEIELAHGYVDARVPGGRLRGARFTFDVPTVTGTENLLMAAALAEGETRLLRCAREPEVKDLAEALRGMGARVEGDGGDEIVVKGVERLRPLRHAVLPDRIEAGTLLLAGALPGSDVVVRGAVGSHLEALVHTLRAAGVAVEEVEGGLRARGGERPRAADFATAPFPGFPTDMQAQVMALLAVAAGLSLVTESVFENRFMHVQELQRLGADLAIDGRTVRVRGVPKLSGAPVMASDSARLGGPRAGRAPGARHHRGAARLPPRPRLPAARGEARAAGGAHPEGEGLKTVSRRGRPAVEPLLTVAVPKGRLLSESSALFERALGVSPRSLLEGTRKLAAEAPEAGLRFISIRAGDVASYVEHGAADLGVAGLDVLREEPRDLYEPLDLGIGRCAIIVARPTGAAPLPRGVAPRVATKYANLAAQHFARKALPAEIIALHGSIEVAPSLGLADAIVDITETGETLAANGLSIEETVLEVSARLIVNKVALKLHGERLRTLIAALRRVVEPEPAGRHRRSPVKGVPLAKRVDP